MENAVDAIKMAFGMMVFVIAMSVAMYLFNTLSSTSQILLYQNDKTNYYDNIELTGSDITTRKVGCETIIPTLYRYYKENYAVQIFNKSGELVQIFDLNIEGKIIEASKSTKKTNEQNALLSLYGVSKKANLFEAPWMGGNTNKDGIKNNNDIKKRIDLYINGDCGYINGKKVDYRTNNLKNFKNSIFLEQFTEYAYKGDTISVGTGDGVETITGNAKVENKIVITYKEQ